MTMTKSQITMQVELQRRYDETMAWVKAEEGRCAFTNRPADEYIVELAERGIFTIEEYDLEEDRCTLSDTYKDVWGVRPRHLNIWEMSAEEVAAEMRSCCDMARREREYEAQHAAEEDAGRKREADLLLESPILVNSVLSEDF